ncbi:MAG: response regulator [Mariprofundus sp.]|nr:response regulator [Mariprofundus sp.]
MDIQTGQLNEVAVANDVTDKQRAISVLYFFTFLLSLISLIEYFQCGQTSALMSGFTALLCLLLLISVKKSFLSPSLLVPMLSVCIGAIFIYEFQFGILQNELVIYILLVVMIYHISAVGARVLYGICWFILVLILFMLGSYDFIQMAHDRNEIFTALITLTLLSGWSIFMELERQRELASGAILHQKTLDHAVDLQVNYLSSLENLDMALLIPSFENALHLGLTEVLKQLDCSRAWLCCVREEAGVWRVPYEVTTEAYPKAFLSGEFMAVDGVIDGMMEKLKKSKHPMIWQKKEMPVNIKWLTLHHVESQMIVALHTQAPGTRWFLGLHQCEPEKQWTPLNQQLFTDFSFRIGAALNNQLLYDRLKHETEGANAESAAKSLFLATMSHELRTPLHGIIGMQDLLNKASHELTAEHRQLLDLAQHSSHVLSSLIDDILDLSKVEADKIELDVHAFELTQFLQDALLPFLMRAKDKNINLYLEYQAIPKYIMGDERRIRQVLLNLLGNAVKFTNVGKVEVIASYQDGHLNLIVRDTGIGIASDKLDIIFEPFVQVSDGGANRQGSGLGSTIAQKFVHLMYGHIEVSSQLGVGSAFTVALPLSAVDEERVSNSMDMADVFNQFTKEKQPVDEQPVQKKMYILLAEDNVISRKIAVERIKLQPGWQVDEAENGLQAWEMFQQHPYDVLLTDISMPGLSGIELTQRIRLYEKEHECSRLSIIAVSANVLEEVVQECRAAGMDDFISKPITPDNLIRRL